MRLPRPPTDSTTLPVLVVGATGSLGSKVVDELLRRGKNANDIDTIGNANLAEAAHRTGIGVRPGAPIW